MKANNKSNKIMIQYKRNIFPKFIIYSFAKMNASYCSKHKNKSGFQTI